MQAEQAGIHSIHLAIKEKAALYVSYMPQLREGGLFIPSTRGVQLADDIQVSLTLPDSEVPYVFSSKVVWITPPRATGGRAQGFGVAFPIGEVGHNLRQAIARILGNFADEDKLTQTM